jgi:hypothetical protein
MTLRISYRVRSGRKINLDPNEEDGRMSYAKSGTVDFLAAMLRLSTAEHPLSMTAIEP